MPYSTSNGANRANRRAVPFEDTVDDMSRVRISQNPTASIADEDVLHKPAGLVEYEEDPSSVYKLAGENSVVPHMQKYTKWAPVIAAHDMASETELDQLNDNCSYQTALFDSNNACGYFHAPCPVVPLTERSLHYFDLNFSLPSEVQSIMEFTKKYERTGIVLTVTGSQLAPLLNSKVDMKRSDFHILPVGIEVIHASSNLPISFDLTLSSSSAKKGQPVSWSEAHGVCNAGDAVTHVVIPPYQNGELPSHAPYIYKCSNDINTASFAQWMQIDIDQLLADILNKPTEVVNGIPVIKFVLPHADEKRFNRVDWFLVTEWWRIVHRTDEMGLALNTEWKINQLQKDDQGKFVLIPTVVLKDIIYSKRTRFNKQKVLMNLSEVTLHADPVLGVGGWRDLATFADTQAKHGNLSDCSQIARFNVTVRVAYEPWKGVLSEKERMQRAAENETVGNQALRYAAQSGAAGARGRWN